MKASKEGLHIRCANRRVDNYVLYELWNKDTYVCSAYGPCAVMCLALTAERLDKTHTMPNPPRYTDWLLHSPLEGN